MTETVPQSRRHRHFNFLILLHGHLLNIRKKQMSFLYIFYRKNGNLLFFMRYIEKGPDSVSTYLT